MGDLDEQEVKIVKELIRNPRITDNKLAKKTKIPVMTVNRKRKRMEEKGLLRYYTTIKHEEDITGIFRARQLYIIKFKIGLTRKKYLEKIKSDNELLAFSAKHVAETYIGEKDGHLALMIILDAETEPGLIECFNGVIIPNIKKNFGNDAIREIITARLNIPLRLHHNYLPRLNMEKGRIKETWLDEWIFVEGENNK